MENCDKALIERTAQIDAAKIIKENSITSKQEKRNIIHECRKKAEQEYKALHS